MRLSFLNCVLVASLGLAIAGCSSNSNGTAAVNTANGSLPIRREASAVVDMAQPNVQVSGNQVIVAGNVRLKSNTLNPDARVQISVVDKYGQVADQIHAKLAATEDDKIMSYRVMFGPVPAKGSSLLVAYDDYHPFANYSGDYVGSGGGGASSNSKGNVTSKKGSSSGSGMSSKGPKSSSSSSMRMK